MASLPLEEFVSCTICFEVFTDPQSLSCRHTLCRRCVKKLKRGSKIQCPMCNTFSDIKDIKPDFNTVSLVDLYKQQQSFNSEEKKQRKDASKFSDPRVCNVCKGEDKKVTALCEECHQYMCTDCEAAHRGIPSLRKHHLKTLQQVSDDIKINLQKFQDTLKEKDGLLKNKQDKIHKELEKLEAVESDTLVKIETSHREFQQQVTNYYDGVKSKIQGWKEEESNKLKSFETMISAELSDIHLKMETVGNAIKSNDPVTLIQNAKLSADFNSEKKNEKHIPDLQTIERRFSVELHESSGFDSQTAAQIEIVVNTEEDEDNGGGGGATSSTSGQGRRMSYKKIDGVYDNRKCIALDSPAKRLYNMKDQLWVVGANVLSAYSKNLQLVKTMVLENVANATAVVHMDPEHLLVTCSVKKALQVLDTNGKFQYTVTKGCFSDVGRYSHMIYVLDYNHCKIYVFRMVGGSLLPSRMFKLQYENGGEYDTMYIKDGVIYVCSWFNHCVYQHAENGDVIAKYGKSGSKTLGALKGPRLCGVDSLGNILVADCGNHRLQMYDVSACVWRLVQVEESTNMGWPYDAVVNDNLRYIWIVDFKSLIKLRRPEN